MRSTKNQRKICAEKFRGIERALDFLRALLFWALTGLAALAAWLIVKSQGVPKK